MTTGGSLEGIEATSGATEESAGVWLAAARDGSAARQRYSSWRDLFENTAARNPSFSAIFRLVAEGAHPELWRTEQPSELCCNTAVCLSIIL